MLDQQKHFLISSSHEIVKDIPVSLIQSLIEGKYEYISGWMQECALLPNSLGMEGILHF